MSEENRRRSVRVSISIEVEYSSGGPPLKARVEDLSEDGVFLDTSPTEPPAVGTELRLSFALPGEKEDAPPIETGGVVIWAAPGGMGVEFSGLAREEKERIKFAVGSVFFGHVTD